MSVGVIGAGISGLVAALTARQGGADVDVFEAGTVGGSLQGVSLAELPFGDTEGLPDIRVDVGGEAGLARRPELPGLLSDLGLTAAHPDPRAASQVWTRGRLRRIPRGIMGVPAIPEEAEDLLGESLVENLTPPLTHDVSVAEFVSARLGTALVDTLVGPLLGGVYASDAHTLSLRATVPGLWEAASSGRSLLELAATLPPPVPGTPVFAAPEGGMHTLVAALLAEARAAGVRIHEHSPVAHVRREAGTWRIGFSDGGLHEAQGLVLATPAWATGALLRDHLATGSSLAAVPHASSAVVTVVIEPRTPLEGSGFLVPPGETRVVKASTFSSRKWPWLADRLPTGLEVVRMSVGRYGSASALQQPDQALLDAAVADFRRLTGRALAPLAGHVQRWDRALPQYLPGHVDLVTALDAEVASDPSLAIVGNAYEGVGVPACIARARRGARSLLEPSHTHTSLRKDNG